MCQTKSQSMASFITKNNRPGVLSCKMITMHRLLIANSKIHSFVAHLSTTFSKTTPAAPKPIEFPAKRIDDAVEKRPELKHFTKDQWQRTFETLTGQGFNTASFMLVIGKRPQLLKRSPEKLMESIECLREAQFGDKNIVELVEKHPEFLEYTNNNELRKKLAFLKTYAKSQRNIFRLIFASPNLITEDDDTTQSKMDYVTDVMRVDETEVSKSTVFSYPLDMIKCRHVFLSRLGMFKPKNPKVDTLQPSKNPKMSSIFDNSARDFAVKTCGVTLEEFETFRELYKREKRSYEDELDDVDGE